jgi:hypothetical protein
VPLLEIADQALTDAATKVPERRRVAGAHARLSVPQRVRLDEVPAFGADVPDRHRVRESQLSVTETAWTLLPVHRCQRSCPVAGVTMATGT